MAKHLYHQQLETTDKNLVCIDIVAEAADGFSGPRNARLTPVLTKFTTLLGWLPGIYQQAHHSSMCLHYCTANQRMYTIPSHKSNT